MKAIIIIIIIIIILYINTKILWNFSVQTDHRINNNKPDIIMVDKIKKEAIIIDVAIPNDMNIARKRLEKLQNYTDLSVEIKTLWRLSKVDIVPVIIGAAGMIHSHLDQDIDKLRLIENKFSIQHAQKITLLGTAHIVRSFLNIAG